MKNDKFLEWPEISFEEVNHCEVENPAARMMYKGLIALLFVPEIVITSFYQILRFKL